MKSSFDQVIIQSNNKVWEIRNVTSIMPNMNGVLIYAENRDESVQIESHDISGAVSITLVPHLESLGQAIMPAIYVDVSGGIVHSVYAPAGTELGVRVCDRDNFPSYELTDEEKEGIDKDELEDIENQQRLASEIERGKKDGTLTVIY